MTALLLSGVLLFICCVGAALFHAGMPVRLGAWAASVRIGTQGRGINSVPEVARRVRRPTLQQRPATINATAVKLRPVPTIDPHAFRRELEGLRRRMNRDFMIAVHIDTAIGQSAKPRPLLLGGPASKRA